MDQYKKKIVCDLPLTLRTLFSDYLIICPSQHLFGICGKWIKSLYLLHNFKRECSLIQSYLLLHCSNFGLLLYQKGLGCYNTQSVQLRGAVQKNLQFQGTYPLRGGGQNPCPLRKFKFLQEKNKIYLNALKRKNMHTHFQIFFCKSANTYNGSPK